MSASAGPGPSAMASSSKTSPTTNLWSDILSSADRQKGLGRKNVLLLGQLLSVPAQSELTGQVSDNTDGDICSTVWPNRRANPEGAAGDQRGVEAGRERCYWATRCSKSMMMVTKVCLSFRSVEMVTEVQKPPRPFPYSTLRRRTSHFSVSYLLACRRIPSQTRRLSSCWTGRNPVLWFANFSIGWCGWNSGPGRHRQPARQSRCANGVSGLLRFLSWHSAGHIGLTSSTKPFAALCRACVVYRYRGSGGLWRRSIVATRTWHIDSQHVR